MVVIYKVAFPRITQLGRLPGTNIYRSILMYPEAETTPGVLVLRIDAAIQFFCCEASAAAVQPGHFEMLLLVLLSGAISIAFLLLQGIKEYIRKAVQKRRAQDKQSGDPVRVVVLDLAPVTGDGIQRTGEREGEMVLLNLALLPKVCSRGLS